MASSLVTKPEIGAIAERDAAHVKASYLGYAIVLFAFLIYVGNTYRSSLERWDDAFITFRYAQHLAGGQGLAWNVGGAPAEGFTSLLHVAMLAGGIKLGIDPQQGSLAISLGAVIVTVALMILALRRYFSGLHPAAAIVVGLYLLDNDTAIHTTSGLETQLFVALLCCGYVAALSFIESPRWSTSVSLGVLMFLAALCRPEAVVYGGAVLAALAFHTFAKTSTKAARRSDWFKLIAVGGCLLFLGSIYAIWKLSYFGYLLPNPYYVKSGRLSLAGWRDVLRYLAHVAVWLGPLIIAYCFFILYRSGGGRRSPGSLQAAAKRLLEITRGNNRRAELLVTVAPPLLALAYYLTIIHEVGGAHRFSYPTYFYLVMAAAAFITLSLRGLSIEGRKWRRFGSVVSVYVLAIIIYQGSWKVSAAPPSEFFRYHYKIASALNATGLGSSGTVLCDAAGVIPYFSNFNQIDRVGLTDNTLSGREPMSAAAREAYLWSRDADVYVGYEPPATPGFEGGAQEPRLRTPYVSQSLLGRKLTGIEDRIFVQNPALLYARMKELRDHWTLVGEMSWPGWQVWKLKSFIYVRRGSPNERVLLNSLSGIVAVGPNHIDLDQLK